MSYLADYAEIDRAATALAASNSALCRRQPLPHPTSGSGRTYHYLEIKHTSAAAGRPVAMIVGGIHARELIPPAALMSFAIKLVAAYDRGDFEHRAFTDPDGNVPYSRWRVKHNDVRRIVDEMTILIVPVANPDGRDFVLAGNPGWRGNRNLADCAAYGVDINRNFDIGWPSVYYTAADETAIEVQGGTTPACEETFRGPSPASENETKNVQELVDSNDVRCFIDVHSAGRRILVPWAMADSQSTDPAQTFTDATLNRRADGSGGRSVLNGSYKEYLPDDPPGRVKRTLDQMAERMKQAILDQAGANATARQRSTYEPVHIVRLMHSLFGGDPVQPLPSSTADYALARQFKPGEPGPAYSFGFECGYRRTGLPGTDPVDEGGFVPTNAIKYQKIEREIHAALWGFLGGTVSTKKKGKNKK